MTQKMCDKSVNTHPSTTEYVPDQFKTQVVSEDPFFIAYCLNRYKT